MSSVEDSASKSYRDYLLQSLREPEEAAAYLESALEEKEPQLIKLALENILEALSDSENHLGLTEQETSGICKLVQLLEQMDLELKVVVTSKVDGKPALKL